MSQPATIEGVVARIDQIALAGDYDAALAASRNLAKARPQDARSHLILARTLEGAARFDEACNVLQNALFLLGEAGAAAVVRRALADALRRLGRTDEALATLDRGLEKHPASPPLVAGKATTLLEAGKLDDADALVAGLFADGDAPPELAAVRARVRDRQGRHADGAAELLAYIERTNPPPAVARMLQTRAGDLLEKAGDPDAAMDCYDKANVHTTSAFDADAHDRVIGQLIERCSADALAAAPRATTDAPRLVLVVGMPRSGTSLCERILAAHPGATAGGELNHLVWASRRLLGAAATPVPDIAALTQPKLDDTAKWYAGEIDRLAPPTSRLTDKSPLNFLRLYLAPLLLPGVKVVHCLRDPRDTCISNYAQQFSVPFPFAGSLKGLGRFYLAYRRLMDHWATVLPPLGAPIYELRYEALVADPEPESRRLLEFVGLPWDDAVLRPHEARVVTWTASRDQVTEPINTSAVGRAQRFGPRIQPLLDALGEYAHGIDPAPR